MGATMGDRCRALLEQLQQRRLPVLPPMDREALRELVDLGEARTFRDGTEVLGRARRLTCTTPHRHPTGDRTMPDSPTSRYLVAYAPTGDTRHVVSAAALHSSPLPPASLCNDTAPQVRADARSSIGVSANTLAVLVAALPLASWCAGCLAALAIPAPTRTNSL